MTPGGNFCWTPKVSSILKGTFQKIYPEFRKWPSLKWKGIIPSFWMQVEHKYINVFPKKVNYYFQRKSRSATQWPTTSMGHLFLSLHFRIHSNSPVQTKWHSCRCMKWVHLCCSSVGNDLYASDARPVADANGKLTSRGMGKCLQSSGKHEPRIFWISRSSKFYLFLMIKIKSILLHLHELSLTWGYVP